MLGYTLQQIPKQGRSQVHLLHNAQVVTVSLLFVGRVTKVLNHIAHIGKNDLLIFARLHLSFNTVKRCISTGNQFFSSATVIAFTYL